MSALPLLIAQNKLEGLIPWMLVLAIFAVLFVIVVLIVAISFGKLWFQAYMSSARVSLWSLIGMSLRKVDARTIVRAKVMAMQSGIASQPGTGISSRRLEAHYLAGGDVPKVLTAIIAAPPGRHRLGLRSRRGNRSCRPRRARRRADQRQS